MCRLFGLSGGPERVSATFWLLEAPDSLSVQSHQDPDGTGLGAFLRDGTPYLAKQPLAAYADRAFAQAARTVRSQTFIAHVRYASTGAVALQNTHPFEQRGRLFAHNGVIGDVSRLEQRLAAGRELVHGETDSERFFALITQEIELDGDVGAAIARAASWIAANLPVFALNCVLITSSELWALRYPAVHELHLLERGTGAGAAARGRELRHRGSGGELRVHCPELGERAAVVVASEPMDDDPGWRALTPGELIHVDADLRVHSRVVLDGAPAHPLTLADLDPRAAASQQAGKRQARS